MSINLKKFIYKKFSKNLNLSGGRNRMGRITVAHRGSKCALKRKFVDLDLQHSLINISYVLVYIRAVPRRTGHAGLILYKNGLFSYILLEKTASIGTVWSFSRMGPYKVGHFLKLLSIPDGFFIFNLELKLGYGGQVGRSAGISLKILNKFINKYNKILIKFRSGDQYFVNVNCGASLGVCANSGHWHRKYGSAGIKRRLFGYRSHVRGVAMNPVDHPHGGNTPGGHPCMTPKGLLTKGVKTRRRKILKKVIFKRRVRRIDCIIKIKNYKLDFNNKN